MIDSATLILRLSHFGIYLPQIVSGISPDDGRWKPADGAWSIMEIVRHLLDEEIEDFRTRLRLTMESPDTDWPPIHPEGWAVQRDYNSADLPKAAGDFSRERAESVRWLRSLVNPDWSTEHRHPQFGAFRGGDLLASWAAHDALHLRQIAKRLHQLAGRDGGEFSIRYAGEWRA